MAGWLEALDRRARLRARAGLTRRLRPRSPPTPVIDLAGNDYLGLSRHPAVTAAATAALTGYGLGATGSRLVRGSTEPHHELEADLADWLGTAGALVYSSGYLANLGAVRALARPRTLLVSDAHNHASLIDGCRISGAETVVTPHADVDAVDAALAAAPGRPAVVVTESVFSVDGDLAPLARLHEVARRYGALLLVDDAHALGVRGPAGAGAVAAAGLAGEPDVVVTATLSKALGGAGGVVAGPAELIRHLVDTGRTFIYDTALPPAVAAGVLAAHRPGPGRRRAARRARRPGGRRRSPAPRGRSDASRPRPPAVLSVTAPGPEEAVAWAAACRDRGVAVGCFRPPSTPDNRSRLRLTVNAGVPRADFDRALDVIVDCAAAGSRPPSAAEELVGGAGSRRAEPAGRCADAAWRGPVLVTGTDTGVGKTVVTAAIAAAAQAAGLRVAVRQAGPDRYGARRPRRTSTCVDRLAAPTDRPHAGQLPGSAGPAGRGPGGRARAARAAHRGRRGPRRGRRSTIWCWSRGPAGCWCRWGCAPPARPGRSPTWRWRSALRRWWSPAPGWARSTTPR